MMKYFAYFTEAPIARGWACIEGETICRGYSKQKLLEILNLRYPTPDNLHGHLPLEQ